MRRIRKKISKKYETAASRSRRHIKERPYILPIFGLLLGFIIVGAALLGGNAQTLRPSDAHVVFLFDKNDRTVVDTKAKTVGDMVNKLPLHLIAEDVVEPSLDTPIVEDNFRVNIYRARPVTVVDNGSKSVTLTAQKSPRVVAQAAGLTLQPEDVANFEQGLTSESVIGEKVVISRATPIALNLYGAQLNTYTQAKTVKDLLREKQINLADGESVQPDQNTLIEPNLSVIVLRKDAKIVTAEEEIAPPEQVVNDPSLSFGATAERQKGSPGKKLLTYILQTDSSGKETSRQVIHEAVIQEPVPHITARGSTVAISGDKTGIMASAGISSGDYAYVNYVISRESNWNPNARNAGGCLGLGQACPGGKLTAVCPNLDPVCQLKFFSGYANGRYGGWGGAYNFWLSHHYW